MFGDVELQVLVASALKDIALKHFRDRAGAKTVTARQLVETATQVEALIARSERGTIQVHGGLLVNGKPIVRPEDDFTMANRLLNETPNLLVKVLGIHDDKLMAYILLRCIEAKEPLPRNWLLAAFEFALKAQGRQVARVDYFSAKVLKEAERFRQGRKQGATSLLRKSIKDFLNRNPRASAMTVWDSLKARDLKKLKFHESPRLGKYVEQDGRFETQTGWRRFQNIVSEEKSRLRNSRVSEPVKHTF